MIKELYDKVFNADGSIKLCGRETCKNLIDACSKEYPNVDFGNNNGFMNIANIKRYVNY